VQGGQRVGCSLRRPGDAQDGLDLVELRPQPGFGASGGAGRQRVAGGREFGVDRGRGSRQLPDRSTEVRIGVLDRIEQGLRLTDRLLGGARGQNGWRTGVLLTGDRRGDGCSGVE